MAATCAAVSGTLYSCTSEKAMEYAGGCANTDAVGSTPTKLLENVAVLMLNAAVAGTCGPNCRHPSASWPVTGPAPESTNGLVYVTY
jgi:hypothetical protein